jgi:hypothetical protein
MPSAASIRNKNGTKSLDFDSRFIGIVNPEDEEDNRNINNDAVSNTSGAPSHYLKYTADQDDILTINQSDLSQRKTRHKHFATWLVKTFGLDLLNSGSGVLDVAGGNGKVSSALAKLGVQSTIVDPKPIILSQSNTKGDLVVRVIPEPLIGDGRQLTEEGTNRREVVLERSTTATNTTTHHFSNDNRNFIFLPPSEYAEVVRNCSVIVGLHPDAATEPIVQTALRLNKPFAVSPCCVVSKLFPSRRRKASGEMVRTTWDLCRYILDLSPTKQDGGSGGRGEPGRSKSDLLLPGFEVELLPFAGRNKVIYWRAGSACGTGGKISSPLDSMYCQDVVIHHEMEATTSKRTNPGQQQPSSQNADGSTEKKQRLE